jgi:hypothetical protein
MPQELLDILWHKGHGRVPHCCPHRLLQISFAAIQARNLHFGHTAWSQSIKAIKAGHKSMPWQLLNKGNGSGSGGLVASQNSLGHQMETADPIKRNPQLLGQGAGQGHGEASAGEPPRPYRHRQATQGGPGSSGQDLLNGAKETAGEFPPPGKDRQHRPLGLAQGL